MWLFFVYFFFPLSTMLSPFIHVVSCIRLYSICCCWIIFYCMDILLWCIHVLVDGHLGWFIFFFNYPGILLPWILMEKFVCDHAYLFLLGRCLGVELLSHMIIPCLPFWETVKSFSKVAVAFYIPTSHVGQFWFLYILPSTSSACLPFSLPISDIYTLPCVK